MRALLVALLCANLLQATPPTASCFAIAPSGGAAATNVAGGVQFTLPYAFPNTTGQAYYYTPSPTLPLYFAITPSYSTGNGFIYGGGFQYKTGSTCPGATCVGKMETIGLYIDTSTATHEVFVAQWSSLIILSGGVAAHAISGGSGTTTYFEVDHTAGNLLFYYSTTSISGPFTLLWSEADTAWFSGAASPNTVGLVFNNSFNDPASSYLLSAWTGCSATVASPFAVPILY